MSTVQAYEPDPELDTPVPGMTIDFLGGMDTDAPHETAGVLRMQRHGMKGPQIAKALGIPPLPLHGILEHALDQEQAAADASRPIHDAGIEVK